MGEGLPAFLLTALIVELTPGPNMAWLAILAATDGARAGLAAVAGVALGLLVVGVAAGLGVAGLVAASPALYATLRWAGAAWLLWMAWEGWRGARDGAEPLPATLPRAFRRGLVTNLLNPKAAAFYVAVLPGFLDPAGDPVRQGVGLALAYVAVATSVHVSLVAAAGQAGRLLSDPVRERAVRRALSLALAGVAVWLLLRT